MLKIAVVASWKINGFYKADASKVANEIQSLGNDFTPQEIVDMARDSCTELHKCFEWDNEIAAEKYRLTQAQHILRLLVVSEIKNENECTKTNLRIFHKDFNKKHSYTPIHIAVKNEHEYESLLKKALEELKAFKKKYHMLSELEEILALID